MSDRRDIKAEFDKHTAEHVMAVLRADGVYRHLMFRKPGTVVYGFDILTWPGYLAITGDMGCYVFSRTEDMLDFFGSGDINPGYWSEKLQAPDGRDVREFDSSRYTEWVEEWRDEYSEDLEDAERLKRAVASKLLWRTDGLTEHEAYGRLNEFECEIASSGRPVRIDAAWELDFRRYKYHFIWCLYAITWAIGVYERTQREGSVTLMADGVPFITVPAGGDAS